MTPTITVAPSLPVIPVSMCSEHIEYHRENLVFDALYDAAASIGADPAPIGVAMRMAETSESASLGERLRDGWQAHGALVLRLGAIAVTEQPDGRVRLVVGSKGCSVTAEQDDTGWSVRGERIGLGG